MVNPSLKSAESIPPFCAVKSRLPALSQLAVFPTRSVLESVAVEVTENEVDDCVCEPLKPVMVMSEPSAR